MRAIIISIICFLFCASSCTIEKRHYRSGFYFHHKQRTYTAAENSSDNKQTEKTEQPANQFSACMVDTTSAIVQPMQMKEPQTWVATGENVIIQAQPEETVNTVEEDMVASAQAKTLTPYVPSMNEPSNGAIAVTTIALMLAITALLLLVLSIFAPSFMVASNLILGSVITSGTGTLLSLIALVINYKHEKNKELRIFSIIAMVLSFTMLLASFVTLLAMAVAGI